MQRLIQRAERIVASGEMSAEKFGHHLVDGFQLAALFVIGGTIVWSAFFSYLDMMGTGVATIEDILLLFVYLELGAMVGIYFKTSRLPVQFLLYVAITVMTRSLASSLSVKEMTDQRLLAVTGAILLLAISVFVVRYATSRLEPFVSHVESDDTQAVAAEQPRASP